MKHKPEIIPYTLPTNWEWVTLDSINSRKSKSITPSQFPNKEFELYSVPIFSEGAPEIIMGKEIKSGKQEVSPDEVLICKINPRINRVWIVGKKGKLPQIASTEWIAIKTPPQVDPYYLLRVCQSNYFRNLLTSNVSGVGGSLTRARPKEVLMYPIPLPPLAEQQRIVAKLDTLMGHIERSKARLAKLPELLKAFRQSVLAQAVSGDLTADWREAHPDVEPLHILNLGVEVERLNWMNKLPSNWKLNYFEISIKSGPQNGIYKPQNLYGEGTLIVRVDNFYEGYINSWETLRRLQLEEKEIKLYGLSNGELIVNRVNSMSHLGKSALVRNMQEPCVFESNIMRIQLNNEIIDSEYCSIFLKSLIGISELVKNAKHAVNQSSINQVDVKNAIISYPPLAEQQEIVRRVEALFAKADAIEAQYEAAMQHLETLPQALLAKAFRGELVEQDENDEPAGLLLERIKAARK